MQEAIGGSGLSASRRSTHSPNCAGGTDILGSVRVTRPDAFLDVLGEAGSAPHFLGPSAEKIVLAHRPTGGRAKLA